MKYDKHPGVDMMDIANTTTSADETCQHRGLASLNGVVILIANETGKCLDYLVKTKTAIPTNTGKRRRL